jgi:ribose 5-phosphate isomerase B
MKTGQKIYLGSDHAGFRLKGELKEYLAGLGIPHEDLGNLAYEPTDDYPDYAVKVAEKVASTGDRGVIICDSGVGVCIAANKVKGIRAANATSPRMARMSREHNNTNVLCLGQDYMSAEEAREILDAWLSTEFSHEQRHHRRVDKIASIEDRS